LCVGLTQQIFRDILYLWKHFGEDTRVYPKVSGLSHKEMNNSSNNNKNNKKNNNEHSLRSNKKGYGGKIH
jgi:hypothetical protein